MKCLFILSNNYMYIWIDLCVNLLGTQHPNIHILGCPEKTHSGHGYIKSNDYIHKI